MGRRSIVANNLISVRLQGCGLACAAGAPGGGPLLRSKHLNQNFSEVLKSRRITIVTEYLRYVGCRSVVADHLFSVRLQGHDLACAAGAPARGAPLAWSRCYAEMS